MKIEINYNGEIVYAELIEDKQFLGGYKVIYDNRVYSVLIVDLVDKTILKSLRLSNFFKSLDNQFQYREW